MSAMLPLPVRQWPEISLSALSATSQLSLSITTSRVLTCKGKEIYRDLFNIGSIYRAEKKGWYVVARYFFLALLSFYA